MKDNGNIQEIIQECKDIVTNKDINEALKYLEQATITLEEQDKIIESTILWEFFADLCENLEEEEVLAYSYSKLITRYLILGDHDKANQTYIKASNKELKSFYLDLAANLLSSRKQKTDHIEQKEIVKIEVQDIFGDYNQILVAPNVPFRSLSEIKNFVEDNLPKGAYKIHIYNKNSKTFETTTISTETLSEYEVINIKNVLEVKGK